MRIIFRSILLTGIIIVFAGIVHAQKSWKEITTVEDLCEAYPEQMKNLLDAYDLSYPGLEKVKKSVADGNAVNACRSLLEYYRNGSNAISLRIEQPEQSDRTVAAADTTLKNVFIVQNVRGQVPYGKDGHRDWYYKGPNNDEEWAWLSNRHSQISGVLSAYFETGNPKYAVYIDEFLRDFILKSMPYPGIKSSTSIWRGLEVAARAKVWSRIFYGTLNCEYISPATQLLILSSLPDHAHYNRNFHATNNWLTMEISALATVATNFPEFKEAGAWLDYAAKVMSESMRKQVYSDGVQTELTSHYHNVSLSNFELFENICNDAGKELPAFYTKTIEDMYSYIAHVVRPDGFRALNNDGDRGSDREIILRGAGKYGYSDWEFIATNGESGIFPDDGPSYFYPWAGQLISRSGFDKDAHWSFFDVGPWGSGHQHNDKLHLSIAAYGRDLLVDAGRFAYTGEVARRFRNYATGSAGHNVILIDGKGQEAGPRLAKEPMGDEVYKIDGNYDYATGSFQNFGDIKGDAVHNRALFYVRGEFWVVVDRIETDRPREIKTLWHWAPDCVVEKNGMTVTTDNESGNLAVIPAGKNNFKIEMTEGREKPMQGWYSPEYNKFEPNVCSSYSLKIKESTTLVWLLVPSKEKTPKINASVISETDTAVEIEVKEGKKKWQIKIPYSDSQDIDFSSR